MTALEEIKKALEGVTVQEWTFDGPANSIIIWRGEDTRVCFMTSDGPAKEHAKFITACNPASISELLSTLESLQRENEELRKDKDHISAEKAGIAKNAHNNVDYWKSQAEAAEAEVKRYRVALIAAKTRMRNCRGAIESDQVIDKDVRGSLQNGIRDIQDALASTGGEHHAE